MGVPQRRRSKERNRHRRAQQKITAPKLVACPQCREMKLSHQACLACGYYNGREVLAVN